MAQKDQFTRETSSKCALAITRAIQDYETWFATQPKNDSTFAEHFATQFGRVDCVEDTRGIRVHILPLRPGSRGGGISYLVAHDKFTVLERIFGR